MWTSYPRTQLRGSEQTQLFVWHQSGRSGSFSCTFEMSYEVPSVTSGDLRRLCKEGRLKEAMHVFDVMNQHGIKAKSDDYVCLLQACINMKTLREGKLVHAHIAKSELRPDIFLENTLVNLYSKCGSLFDARQVFDKMAQRNVFTWTIMIAAYSQHGPAKEALKLYWQMEREGVEPDQVTFVSILKACSSLKALDHGKQIHAHIIKCGFESNVFVGSSLVGMYGKCRSMENALQVFNRMPHRNVVSWNAMIAGYADHGHGKEGLNLFRQMEQEGVKPNEVTFLSILKACSSLTALEQGKKIHARIIKSGFESKVSVANTLIDMYGKCGSMVHACQVFDKLPIQNVVSWTAMIAGYTQQGQGEKALELFWQMEAKGVKPDRVTFLHILKACTSLAAVEQGKQIHAHIIKSGLDQDVCLGNSLVDMYAKCGSIEHGCRVFNKMPKRDVVSWTAMIRGYSQHGQAEEAIKLFWQMEPEGVKPNAITFVSVLKACASLAALEEGKQIHAHIIKNGFESDVFVGSTLVDMYGKCRSIEHACKVFNEMPIRDVVSWTAMIAGYAEAGHGKEALALFWQMEQEGLKPDKITFVSILKVCASLQAIEEGKQIHTWTIKGGFESDIFVGNALIDMYAKCGRTDLARQVFDKMPERDVVSWNAVIAGYVEHGLGEEALKLFWLMRMKPDEITFVSMLKICASVGALEQGKQIHTLVIERGFELGIFLGNTLVDMYAKCGSLDHARQVFDELPERDVVSWTAMVAGYAQHGHGKEALQLVEQMLQDGMKLDHIAFVCILSACSHTGLVDEGRNYFDSMSRDHGIIPTAEHYACMVDLLGRAGHLEEAESFIKRMPFQPSAVLWTTLLGACRIHGNLDVAKRVAECLFKLEPQNDSAFVLLSNIYAAAGRWDDKAKVRKMMGNTGVRKKPGSAGRALTHTCLASGPHTTQLRIPLATNAKSPAASCYSLST